ncbi:hypothetical protein Nepgr_016748 [Nepenthes gracilis]|uniref:GDP-mannose 4,6-dehydratase n=1 Tax=Nepenthes gracilis TaxID=150966 RepID=A0AAD3XRK5_NEPGR|nr:hypothetical protein Nepgr_016748 [Nepenthes gracilis]
MESVEHVDLTGLESCPSRTDVLWRQEMERCESQLVTLQAKFTGIKGSIEGSEEESKELNVLWRRVKAAGTLLTYLKARARILAVPHLAQASFGIKQLEGVGLVDKNGIPLSSWSKNVDLSLFDSPDEETWIRSDYKQLTFDEQDGSYIGELLKSVQMVTNVMEALVKRVIIAESETAIAKERVNFGLEDIKKKESQIKSMSFKLEEMERFALGTNCILSEMRQRVEDLVEETSRQRQRAAENEHELSRVKRDFESLKSYVSSLISVRETLISSEKQFQTIEKLFERLVAKTTQMEGEKLQKEAEVQKLMEENVRLHSLLDKKEAQLLAMNEQCKVLALTSGSKTELTLHLKILFHSVTCGKGPQPRTRIVSLDDDCCYKQKEDGRIETGLQSKLFLGNLQASPDWGFAGDYVEAMWMMLQQDNPDGYVMDTEDSHTVEEFLAMAFGYVGQNWKDDVANDNLKGHSTMAKRLLGWKPRVGFEQLEEMMVDKDIELAKQEKVPVNASYLDAKQQSRFNSSTDSVWSSTQTIFNNMQMKPYSIKISKYGLFRSPY